MQYGGLGREEGRASVCVAGRCDGDGGVEEEGPVSWYKGRQQGRGRWLEHGLGLVQQRPECQVSLVVSRKGEATALP